MLQHNMYLKIDKFLKFNIVETNVKEPYDIYWKVKNEGSEALRLNQIRGKIKKTDMSTHIEITSFKGFHYVECYIVKNNVCVAIDKINVPISI